MPDFRVTAPDGTVTTCSTYGEARQLRAHTGGNVARVRGEVAAGSDPGRSPTPAVAAPPPARGGAGEPPVRPHAPHGGSRRRPGQPPFQHQEKATEPPVLVASAGPRCACCLASLPSLDWPPVCDRCAADPAPVVRTEP
jgi:hypothetical protein